jgi:dolichol kinase
MGLVTTVAAFYFLKRDMKRGVLKTTPAVESNSPTEVPNQPDLLSTVQKRFFAFLVPLLFAADVAAMSILDLAGGDATALIGGTSILILLLITLTSHKNKGLEKTTQYLIEGFTFGFKVFGPVIPIAAFFYLGDSGCRPFFLS